MKRFLLTTTLMLSILLFALFSDKANEVSKPYIAKLIESNIDKNITIEIEEYKLDYDYITLLAKANQKNHIKLYGKFDALSQNFDLNYSIDSIGEFIELKEINIPPNTPLHGNIKSKIKENTALIDATAKSTIANLTLTNGKLNLETMELFSKFQVDIQELKKLKFITKKELNGRFEVTGELTKKEKELLVIGSTNSFDGKINFTLKNDDLNASIESISVEKLFKTLDYPIVFTAPLSGDMIYNLKTKRGNINSTLKNAKLVPNKLTKLVKRFSHIDLTKEIYNQTTFNAKLYPKEIKFKLLAEGKRNKISIYNAKLKQESKQIDAKYKISINRAELGGTIKGDINSPHISINGSRFIKKEVKSVLDKYINREHQEKIESQLKDFGINKEDANKAINRAEKFIKGFF